jgi:SAM-dependent methyltransferase
MDIGMAADYGELQTIGERKMASHPDQSLVSPPARRFHSAAAHYLAGRPPYAGLLIRRVASLVGLDEQHSVLDLGCGPGQLARAFAPLAREVVAMDPAPEMLLAAEAASAGIGNIRYVNGGSDDLTPSGGCFRLVVMGRSFHWMDRAATLRALDNLIERGGGLALFNTNHAAVPANAWVEHFDAARRRFASDDPERPRRYGASWVRHEALLLSSPFSHVETCSVFERRSFDAVRLIDRAFSTSSTEPERLGNQSAELEHDIVALVKDIAPNGCLTEVIESTALIARRPHEETSS